MNKYIRACVCVPYAFIKIAWTKLFHLNSFSGSVFALISPHTEITMERGANLKIGSGFKMRDGAKIRVRTGASCIIGKNSSVNTNNIIACHERIEIGNDVQLSPNVQIYDHDHDFRTEGGVKSGLYRTKGIKIGNNVWIGTNTVILKGAQIGDNCVIGAGCVISGQYAANTVVVQKRMESVREIKVR